MAFTIFVFFFIFILGKKRSTWPSKLFLHIALWRSAQIWKWHLSMELCKIKFADLAQGGREGGGGGCWASGVRMLRTVGAAKNFVASRILQSAKNPQ